MNHDKIRLHIVEEVKKQVDIAVMGISGGADSLLVALLMRDALGGDNVYTLSMPYSDIDYAYFNKDSELIAGSLGIKHRLVPITNTLNVLKKDFVGPHVAGISQLCEGNLRSRLRMCLLYAHANYLSECFYDKRVRVIGTGNLSEDYIGYDTKGGDALADIFPIGELLKSEVYAMLEFYRDRGDITEQMINRKPSAGLWDGQTDEDELGYTYAEMEKSVIKLAYEAVIDCKKLLNMDEVDEFVWNRHKANKHKHAAPPVVILRDPMSGRLLDG